MRQLLCTLLLVSGLAQAEADITPLTDFLGNLDSLSADFSQTRKASGTLSAETSTGQMRLQRPGLFRWHTHTPYEQLVVADGEKVWFYDVDLEQVTVSDMQAATRGSPASLLSNRDDVLDNFSVAVLEGEQPLYELRPLGDQGGFERILISLEQGRLATMTLEDEFGQVTEIAFSQAEANIPLDAADFRFVPPPDVDVVGQ